MGIVKIMASEFVKVNSVYFAEVDTKQSVVKQMSEAKDLIESGEAKQNSIKTADEQTKREVEITGIIPYALSDARTEYKTAKMLLVALKEKASEETESETETESDDKNRKAVKKARR